MLGMNKLPMPKRAQILNLLCEGMSMRAVSRIADVSLNTVAKALVDAGTVCAQMHDELVQGVKSSRIECDEIWAFNYCKQRAVSTAKSAPVDAGDLWTWTGIDADSKLTVSYLVADRSGEAALALMDDLRGRLVNPRADQHGRPQGLSGSRRRCVRRRCGLCADHQALWRDARVSSPV